MLSTGILKIHDPWFYRGHIPVGNILVTKKKNQRNTTVKLNTTSCGFLENEEFQIGAMELILREK